MIGGKDMRCCANKNDRPDGWRQFIACFLAASLAPLATGCDTYRDSSLTGKLWNAGGVNWCEPAPKPNIRIYAKPDDSDTLVTYDELREENGEVRRRAFFLLANLGRIEKGKKPIFIGLKKIEELKLLPVAEYSMTNAPPTGIIFVNPGPEEKAFTVVWAGQKMGPYNLPTYAEFGSRIRRVLLTPLAVTGDVVVVSVLVGSVAGVYVLYLYCSGPNSTGR
jgi:hypothetical protein